MKTNRKRRFAALAAVFLLLLSCMAASAADKPYVDEFRVMTFNLLNSGDKASRFAAICATVDELSPDIVGFQECREGFAPLLADVRAAGYRSAIDTLRDDPLDSGIVNCVPIYYRADRFALVAGSAGARRFTEKYGDSWTKSMCWCVLESKVSGKRYIVLNVHFAVYSASYGLTPDEVRAQRVSNAAELLGQLAAMREEYGELPVIALGDFNMNETERAYRALTAKLADCAHLATDARPYLASYHGGTGETGAGGYPIDHIFVSEGDFSVTSCRLFDTPLGRSASDHYPLYADLVAEGGKEVVSDTLPETPLLIADATRRTPYSDAFEGFTVVNVSDRPVDLSRILVWYGTAGSDTDLKALDARTVTSVMRLCAKRGGAVLAPGEKAFVWCVFSAAYKNTVPTAQGAVRLVERGADGRPVYRTDRFREAVRYLAAAGNYSVSEIEEATRIVPLDRTTQDAFGADGAYRNLPNSFNLQNTVYMRLYLTSDTACDASEAFCTADLDGTGGGTYRSGGSVKVRLGSYRYTPAAGAALKTLSFEENAFPFGCLDEDRAPLFGILPAAPTVIRLTLGSATAYVNGAARVLDAAPMLCGDRTVLPARFVAEAFGASVAWHAATATVTVIGADGKQIVFTVGSTAAVVDGKKVTLEVPVRIEHDRAFVPVRFLAESLGATVTWNGATATATLTKK